MIPDWTLIVSDLYQSVRLLREANAQLEGGFQLLHAAFSVEHFLQGLTQRKCNFHIVFFNRHSALCVPRNTSKANRAKYLLARWAIICHLQRNLWKTHPAIEIHVFQSVRSQGFVQYLRDSGIYFLMCHDGANAIPISEDLSIQDKSEAEKNDIHMEELERRKVFRALICELIRQGYNVALINGLEWADTKVSRTICVVFF